MRYILIARNHGHISSNSPVLIVTTNANFILDYYVSVQVITIPENMQRHRFFAGLILLMLFRPL